MNNEYEPFKVKKFFIVYTFQSELNTYIKTLTIKFSEINMSKQKFNLHDYEDYYNESRKELYSDGDSVLDNIKVKIKLPTIFVGSNFFKTL